MSAFIVDPEQIKGILITYNSLQYKPLALLELENMAKVLYAENVRSVNYRYNEKTKTKEDFNFSFYPRLSIIQAIKFCDCLGYQSCERPDYEKSKAYHLLNKIRVCLYSALLQQSKELNAQYDSAMWSL